MIDWLTNGGPVMVPILLGSVIALAVFLERLVALRRTRVLPDDAREQIERLASAGRWEEAGELCRASNTPWTRIVAQTIALGRKPRARLKEAAEEVGRVETAQLQRWVEVVGTVAAVEPLLGLLGTVTGMISAFQRVAVHGLGDPTAFAAGIWEALITTAAGLVIAIPAFLAYRLLLSRVERLALEMEERTLAIIDRLAVD